jgi:sigma-B regulation protein RsbU (phosphoserine phosphatase)
MVENTNDDVMGIGAIEWDEDSDIEMRISPDGTSIVIDAVEDSIDFIQDFIKRKLLSYGCEKKPLMQIRLAVEEIFVNIISYAYRPDIGKAEIYVSVSEAPLSVTILFMDAGKPFDPLARPDADTSGKMFMERPGGFGILLVKNTMDAVNYEYKDGKNILSIKKNL